MYFQFLTEDETTKILVEHIIQKFQKKYSHKEIEYSIKSFSGIGHVPKKGTVMERKTGKLLNDLPMYLRAFNKSLGSYGETALFIVLDNDKRDKEKFRQQLEEIAINNMVVIDYVYCVAVKEIEAWLLGDIEAIEKAYPSVKKNPLKKYEQDEICDTWEVLAEMVYPGGLTKLKKKAGKSYGEIGKAKCAWADEIGEKLTLHKNKSPSFQYFIRELKNRIERYC